MTKNEVIVWADFPKIEGSKEGYRGGLNVGFTHSPTYASKKSLYRQTTQNLIKIVTLSGIFWLSTQSVAFAESLDDKARVLYYDKFLGLAKWVIAGKGGFDTLNKMLKEDFDGAKKTGIQYIMVFCILLGLPKALDYVVSIFEV